MRYFDQGSAFRVTVSEIEVDAFNRSWPSSALRGSQSFTFEKKNGDLIDHTGKGADGGEAAALADDAKAFGQKRLARDRRKVGPDRMIRYLADKRLWQYQCQKEGTLFYYQAGEFRPASHVVIACPVCRSSRVKVVRVFPAIDEQGGRAFPS